MILFVCVCSCSHLGTNLTKEGSLVVNGGRFYDFTWDSKLVFKRTTWYIDLNMLYDVIFAELELNSPFVKWFYEDEKEELEKCERVALMGIFSSDDRRTSESEIIKQLIPTNARLININGFQKNLSFHPVFVNNSLALYRFEGICFAASSLLDKAVHIPGFPGVNVYK